MLVLFDLDGTLVSTGGAGRRALQEAIEAVTSVAGALEGVRLSGNTDPMILQESFRLHVGRELTDLEFEAIVADYLVRLEDHVLQSSYRVYPGVAELIPELADSTDHSLGLATGNVEGGARIKLRPPGLDVHFGFGGFGSDAGHRGEMVRCGVAKGHLQRELRKQDPTDEVWIVGDTELDVVAGRYAGVKVLGVLVGASEPDALRAAEPDLLVDTLEDPAVRRIFGL